MNKKVVVVLLSTCLALSLFAGCAKESGKLPIGDIPEQTGQNTGDIPTETVTGTEIVYDASLTEGQKCAITFVKAIADKNFEAALSMLNVDTTFISPADLEWYIPRSQFASVVGAANDDYDASSTEKSGTYERVGVVCDSGTYLVDTVLDDNNNWKIDFSEFVVKDWRVLAPGGTKIMVNGIELTQDYKDGTEDLRIYYKIPAAPNRNIPVSVESSRFGTFDMSILPSTQYNEQLFEATEFKCEIPADQMTDIYEQLRVLLNNMNEGYENGETASDFSKYISEKANPQLAQTLYASVTTEYTWNDIMDPTNIRYTVVKGNKDLDRALYCEAKLIDDDTLILNVSVEKTWQEKNDDNSSTRVNGYLNLQCTENGVFIYDIPGNSFIDTRNNFVQQW